MTLTKVGVGAKETFTGFVDSVHLLAFPNPFRRFFLAIATGERRHISRTASETKLPVSRQRAC